MNIDRFSKVSNSDFGLSLDWISRFCSKLK